MSKNTILAFVVLNYLTKKHKSQPITYEVYRKSLKYNFVEHVYNIGLHKFYNENVGDTVDWENLLDNKENIYEHFADEIKRKVSTLQAPIRNLFDNCELFHNYNLDATDLFNEPIKILWYPAAGRIDDFPFERFDGFELEGKHYASPNLFIFTDVSGDYYTNESFSKYDCEFKIELKKLDTENNPNFYTAGHPTNNNNGVTFLKLRKKFEDGTVKSYYVIYANVENNSFAKKFILDQKLSVDYIFNQNWGSPNQIYFKHLLLALKQFGCKVVISSTQLDIRFIPEQDSSFPIIEQMSSEATANLVGEHYSTDEIILGQPHIINNFYYQKVI